MNFILCGINAKFIHTNIAIRLIKKYTQKAVGIKTSICEYTINNHIYDIFSEIYKKSPDVICFSCYIWNIEIITKICTLLKKTNPKIIIILGGPEVSYYPEKVLNDICCDFVISGEGENTFARLAFALEKENPLNDITGITYKCNNIIIKNPPSTAIDMAELGFAYDDFDEISNKICYYEASRGCPYSCRYCLSSIEKGVRFAPLEKVKNELMIFIKHNVKQVKFVDRTFNCNEAFAKEIIKFIIKNDNGITNFHFEVESRLINNELLDLLSSSRQGLFQLEIGVQSTNEVTLNAVNRQNDMKYLKHCMNILLANQNIHIHLDLIAGLPFEDIGSFKKSFNNVYSLQPHQLQLGFLKILKGSSLEALSKEYSLNASCFPPYEVLSTNALSFDDILLLKGVEDMTEIYYNSNRFTNSINFLEGFFDTPFDMFYEMSLFKQHKYISTIVYNKQYPYTFLVEFVSHKVKSCPLAILKTKLKLDFLLHEKPRSVPDWCMDNLIDNNKIYDLTVHKDKIKKLLEGYEDVDNKQLIRLIHIECFPCNPYTLQEGEATYLFNYRKLDLLGNATVIQIK